MSKREESVKNKQYPGESRGERVRGEGAEGSWGAEEKGGGACQRVHSGRTELLSNFDGGIGRRC